MRSSRKFSALSCALFLSFALLFTWSAAAQAASMPSKTISIAYSSTVADMNPYMGNSGIASNCTAAVFEGLVDDDRDGHIAPLLAERWEVNEAGDQWRFFLRKGVKFHNGEPFDAKDVKFTFDYLQANITKLITAASHWRSLVSCKIVDDYTVDFAFDAPNPLCLNALGATAIIPDEAYAQHGEDLWHRGLMYGTGPWMFKEWVEGQYIRLLKNPDYWNKAVYDPYYEEVHLQIIMEPATVVAAHLAGDVQVNLTNGGVSREFMPMYAQAQDRIQKVERKTGMFYYILFQFGEGKVFRDKNARMAFEYCVDRESIAQNVYDGDAEVISSVIPAVVRGFDSTLPPYEYNPEKAKEYLKMSDYDGRKITIISQNTIKKPEDAILAIAENMRAVGFNVDVEVLEYSVFLDRRGANNYDLFYSLGIHPGNDPSEALARRFDTGREGHQYDNEEMHNLIGNLTRDMDEDRRLAYVKSIARLMREEAAPASGICSANMAWYADWGVKGIRFTADGSQRIQYVDFDPSLVPQK